MSNFARSLPLLLALIGCRESPDAKTTPTTPTPPPTPTTPTTPAPEPLECSTDPVPRRPTVEVSICREPFVPDDADPVVKWAKTSFPGAFGGATSSAVSPIVLSLNDDDGDGDVDRNDIPDIVGSFFEPPGDDGVVRALSGRDGAQHWVVGGLQLIGGLAGGDVDGDGLPEIVAMSQRGVMLIEHDGTQAWHTEGITWPGTSGGTATSR